MKTISKIILLSVLTAFLFFACSKDEDEQEPQPIPKTTLSSISPNQGIKETAVTISGINFGTDKTKVKVLFNTTEAVIQSVTNTQIKVLTPINGSTGAIKVSVDGVSVSGPIFTYLQPTLSSVDPESGPKATQVTFTGSTFGTDASKVQVFFNDIEAVVESVTDTQVVALAPDNATSGVVKLIVDGTELTGPEFTFLTPTLVGFTPESGPVGTEVTITGSLFGTDTTKVQVFLDEELELEIKSISDTEIKVDIPNESISGIISIIVDGTELIGNEFVLEAAITGIEPESGIKGTEVTINGSSFITLAGMDRIAVFINDKEAQITSVLDDEIKVIVPAKAFSGNVKVIIKDDEYVGPVFNYIVSEIEVSTFAGSGSIGFSDGLGTAAQFRSPIAIAIDDLSNIYVADRDNYVLRKITPVGEVSTLAGVGRQFGDIDGTGAEARFNAVNAIAFTKSGDMLVCDANNHKIKKVTTGGVVTTFAGTGINGSSNGPALSATFKGISGIAIDSKGNAYIVERNAHAIRKISTSGEVSLYAGDSQPGTTNGNGTAARFNFPQGIAVDAADNLYVTDGGTHLIRKITPNADVSTIAGSIKGFTDGQSTTAQFNFPTGIVVDKQGDIYIVDKNNHSIRKLSSDGNVTTIAGDGTTTDFNFPNGITIDALGDLYVTDQLKHRIRKITQE
ncbi:IPT/TIG domain-containing protein [Maribacter polysiphoniae]|uniref:IPT/TIG domain-containing protein n=1 Tax=Maribacter polysiphoniae TaxID=429344 RepID=A0A316E3D8_9FLAO|nr:IPT/TIG domain-containing protein [Maribacter polysiphoniae]MBD1259359.1 IPT/TIG domain-containing protein [Maribacter polysiphoniae]PWK24921.1 NHL repeat-containing protein [Maribacter polysiphoniae]